MDGHTIFNKLYRAPSHENPSPLYPESHVQV